MNELSTPSGLEVIELANTFNIFPVIQSRENGG